MPEQTSSSTRAMDLANGNNDMLRVILSGFEPASSRFNTARPNQYNNGVMEQVALLACSLSIGLMLYTLYLLISCTTPVTPVLPVIGIHRMFRVRYPVFLSTSVLNLSSLYASLMLTICNHRLCHKHQWLPPFQPS